MAAEGLDGDRCAAPGMDGVILCDKPAGVTSHDVVARVRRELGRGIKVGHAGTLDPFATRVQRFLMELPKTYEVVAQFGIVSTTGDLDGVLTATGRIPDGELVLPIGQVRQRPPAYSAVKIGGRRAYALARSGVVVEMPERVVTVHAFDELWREEDRRAYRIECSSGTYVRSLIADLGDAHCVELRRTRIGEFGVDDASDRIISLDEALAFLPAVLLDREDAVRSSHGRTVTVSPVRGTGTVRLMDSEGLVALAEPVAGGEPGELKPIVGFRG